MDLKNITLTGRWVGFALIALCWIQVIPLSIGWIGFGIAALSFIVESRYKTNMTSSNTDGDPGETT